MIPNETNSGDVMQAAPHTDGTGEMKTTTGALPPLPAYATADSPAAKTIRSRAEAVACLPQYPAYEYINESFQKTYHEPLRVLDEMYDKNGGIHLVEVEEGEANAIVRLPSRDQFAEIIKVSKQRKMSDTQTDDLMLNQILIYPNINKIKDWSEQWAGAVTSIVSYVMREAKLNQAATGKKLFKRNA